MRRSLGLALVAALLLGAGTASAGVYASLRLTGTGNYNLDSYTVSRQGGPSLWDSGLECYKEVAVGFGDKIQGEVSFGFSNLKYEEAIEEESTREDSRAWTENWWTLGAAGYYPIADGKSWTMDAGLRFQYHNASVEYSEPVGDTESSSKFGVKGWSVGPVLRHRWLLAGGAIAIGPEIYPKYTSMKSEWEYSNRDTSTEDGPDISAMDIEYSFRMDFFFQ